jgi:hypothetical protein
VPGPRTDTPADTTGDTHADTTGDVDTDADATADTTGDVDTDADATADTFANTNAYPLAGTVKHIGHTGLSPGGTDRDR